MYRTTLDIKSTQNAVTLLKNHFEVALASKLNLTKFTAPLILLSNSGLNDELSGIERQISFDLKCTQNAVIVHSLAKWKRQALASYKFELGQGIYTDMVAIRRDEVLSPIHSYFVDQWDWETVIDKNQRNIEYLKSTVQNIFKSMKDTEEYICKEYHGLKKKLPESIYFISSQELEDKYPHLTSKQRETEIAKKHGAVFISQIGKKLKSGEIHDTRAPDYDDWELNGDIIVYYELLGIGLELSSMGIRVCPQSLLKQLEIAGKTNDIEKPFHQQLVKEKLPLTMGGGIGQSRLSMFLLDKMHIGEIQASIWTQEVREDCERKNIHLL